MRSALRPIARLARPATYSRTMATVSSKFIPADVRELTEADKANVAATAPVLAEHGVTITKEMYRHMLEVNPDLKNIFSMSAQANGSQPRALAGSVYGYAANIHDLTPLVPTVTRIAEKHAVLGVKPEHYAVVAENLMGAISRVLGDAFTPALQESWYHAYWQLAKIFIDAEADMYAKGAWKGWKDFTITKHVDESGQIASFDLVPTDPEMLPLKPYKPGQFITLRVMIDSLGHYQSRHYSLSDSPSQDRYRITVKREDKDGGSDPDGLVSTTLHALPVGSVIQASFPAGAFTLPSPLPENVVLLSAGVGITPNMSMLNTIAKDQGSTNVSWIQGVKTPKDHVFKGHVAELVAKSNGQIKAAAYYSEGGASEEGIYNGQVKVAELDKDLLALNDPKAVYFVCGPDAFMHDVRTGLEALGVENNRINVEAFRAGEVE